MKYILVWLPFAFLMLSLIMNGITFDIECGGHLKRAADANTVELAVQELEIALAFMESRGMTSGSTGIIFHYPSYDIGYWYTNIKSSHDELVELPTDATPLEKSNMLMKLRETLLDDGKDGQTLTVPSGVHMFPYIVPYYLSILIAFMGAIGLSIAFVRMPSRPRRIGWETYVG